MPASIRPKGKITNIADAILGTYSGRSRKKKKKKKKKKK